MPIKLRFLDMWEDPASVKPPEYWSEIPLPAVRLSVFAAAKMTLRRAREKGYRRRPGRYVVLLQNPGAQMGKVVLLNAAKHTFVPDGATITVSGDRDKAGKKNVWVLE